MIKTIIKVHARLFFLLGVFVLLVSSCQDETKEDSSVDEPVVAKSWGTPQAIEELSGDASKPQMALNGAGEGVVVWENLSGGETHIWANNYSVEFGWGQSFRIDFEPGYASNPQVGMDAYGDAIAVWMQGNGAITNAWANRFSPGLGWSGAEIIDDRPEFVYEPQIAVSLRGDALAIWWQGSPKSIYSSRYSVLKPGWLPPELAEFDESGDARYPEILIDDTGRFGFAVWRQSDGTQSNIWVNDYFYMSGWGIPEKIESNDSDSALQPQIAWAQDSIIAIWHQYEGGVSSIWANRLESGSWEPAKLIEMDDTGDAFDPQISMDSEGNGVAVWTQSDGTRYNIWANRYIIGEGWLGPELLEGDDVGDAVGARVKVDPTGGAWVLWQQSDGTRTNIWGNRLIPDTGWSGSELLETDDAGDARSPQIAFDEEGNAMAVWVQSDGTNFKVMANHFQ